MIKKSNLISLFLIVFFLGCDKYYQPENGGQKMFIENARKFLIQNGHNVKGHIAYVENIQDWEKTYKELKNSENTEFLKRFKVLDGKSFQVIVFKPREPNTLGGVYRVFISDGDILTYYGEK
jgi:hypothetical protein